MTHKAVLAVVSICLFLQAPEVSSRVVPCGPKPQDRYLSNCLHAANTLVSYLLDNEWEFDYDESSFNALPNSEGTHCSNIYGSLCTFHKYLEEFNATSYIFSSYILSDPFIDGYREKLHHLQGQTRVALGSHRYRCPTNQLITDAIREPSALFGQTHFVAQKFSSYLNTILSRCHHC